jgi:thiol-disulfide isomerase/thioredoxin
MAVVHRLSRRRAAYPTALVLTLAAGAALGPAAPMRAADTPPESAPAPASEPSTVDLQPIDDKSLKTEIARRSGKIVLVSLWSRSCPPCIEAYPHLVEMARKYQPQGLEVLSINVIDDERTRRDWSVPFVRKQNPPFPTFFEEAEDDEAFIRALDAKWYGGLPAEFLFGRRGYRVLSMTENVDVKKLEGIIVQHLEGRVESKTDPSMLELRAFVERNGGSVTWNPSTQTVGVMLGPQRYRLKVGSTNVQAGRDGVALDRPPTVEDGRVMVPRSFLDSTLQTS